MVRGIFTFVPVSVRLLPELPAIKEAFVLDALCVALPRSILDEQAAKRGESEGCLSATNIHGLITQTFSFVLIFFLPF